MVPNPDLGPLFGVAGSDLLGGCIQEAQIVPSLGHEQKFSLAQTEAWFFNSERNFGNLAYPIVLVSTLADFPFYWVVPPCSGKVYLPSED